MRSKINNLLNDHLLLVIAVLAALLLYARFLTYGHISWDDPEMVFKNKDVRDFQVTQLFSNHYVGNYIPITMLLHAMVWQLVGNADWGHHLLNILLHLVNALLLYRVSMLLFKSKHIAGMAVVVFLLHPLQVESVGWISELKNILSTTFYLAALHTYLRYVFEQNRQLYFTTLVLFILGCLSKPSVVMLPLTLLLIDYFISGTLTVKLLIQKVPFLLLAVVFGVINIKTQTADLFINHAHEFPYYVRFGMAGIALFKYLLLFLFPVNLSAMYPYPLVKTATVALGFMFWLALFVSVFLFLKNKQPFGLFLILFVLINLLLVLQFLPFGEVLYADRYLYLPIIGFGWGLGKLLSGKLFQITAYLLLFCLMLTTWIRTNAWKSAIVLYEDIIRNYPDQFVALNSAGVENMLLNNDAKALEYLNKATRVAPNNYKGFYNRGLLHLKNNQAKAAITSFNQSLSLYDYPKALVGRASAYFMLGDLPKAIKDANAVLLKDNNNVKAHFVLGNCLSEMDKLDEALKEYNYCLKLNTEEADYYFKRAIVYGKKQDFTACLSDLEVCTSINPEMAEAYYWKGVARVNLHNNPCSDFKIAAQKNYEPAVKAFYKYCN